jgi:hypothetical protein
MPEGRFYGFLVGCIAVCLLTGGLALNVLTVSAVIGPFHLFARDRSDGVEKLGLWFPESSADVAPEERARRLRAWHAAVVRERDMHDSDTLAALTKFRVVVVGDARALTRDEAGQLHRFLESGGGVLLTGSAGVQDAQGRWRGYGLMQRLLRVRRVAPLSADSSGHVTPGRRGPLVTDLEPGRRIALIPQSGAPAIANPEAELLWSEAKATGPAGASRRLEVGRGRLVWLAAGPERALAEHSRELLHGGPSSRILEAAVAWLAREPRLEVLPWPEGAPLAAVRPADAAIGAEASGVSLPRRARNAIDVAVARADRRAGLLHLGQLAEGFPELPTETVQAYAGDALRARGAWFAGSGEYARWRRSRRALDVGLHRAGPQRQLLEMSNRGSETLRDAVVRVYLNAPALRAVVGRTTLQQEEPKAKFEFGKGIVDVRIPELRAGEHLAYTLDVEPLEADEGDDPLASAAQPRERR